MDVMLQRLVNCGESFCRERVIDASRSGNSDIDIDNKSGRIYVLYEDKFGVTDHPAIFNYE